MSDMVTFDLDRPLSDFAVAHSPVAATRLRHAMQVRALRSGRVDPARRFHLALKWFVDLFGAAVALVLLFPVFLAAALAIKIESPGPVFFRQERWGRDNARIRIFKFRSMYAHVCDSSGVAQTVEDDARRTRVGAFLRRSNIDELPQLINVLRGEMSLVGPRCHVVGMQAGGRDYEDLVPDYRLRHVMRPGITGLAQMRGLRGPTIDARLAVQRIESDFEYIARFDILLDIRILVQTVWREVLHGGGGL